jgi:hypothetical protein
MSCLIVEQVPRGAAQQREESEVCHPLPRALHFAHALLALELWPFQGAGAILCHALSEGSAEEHATMAES